MSTSDPTARAGRAILGIYLLVIIPILSFWAPNGYSGLGNDKFYIYRFISVPFAALLLPLVITKLCGVFRSSVSGKSSASGKSAVVDHSTTSIISSVSGKSTISGRLLLVLAMLYLVFLSVSFILASDRAEALWGTTGWRNGFLTRLLYIFFFIAGIVFRPRLRNAHELSSSHGQNSHDPSHSQVIGFRGTSSGRHAVSFPRLIFFPVVFVSGAPVLLLGILNRFSIYPLSFMGVDDSFISTIGNINWYGGYLVFVFAVALGAFVCGRSAVKRFFGAVLLILSFVSLVTQASDGTTLAFAAGFLAACIALCRMKGSAGADSVSGKSARSADAGTAEAGSRLFADPTDRLILLIGFLGIALEIFGILFMFYPLAVVSKDYNFWFPFARYHAGLLLIAVCIVLLLLTRALCRNRPDSLKDQNKPDSMKRLRILTFIVSLAALAFGAFALVVIVVSAAVPDTFLFTGDAGVFPWLSINDSFGNDRGAIWRISGDFFRSLPTVRKLFGVGPDCYSSYGYLDPVISMELVTAFGTARLTNAHCGLFTLLINEGICGALSMAVFYAACWLSLFRAPALRSSLPEVPSGEAENNTVENSSEDSVDDSVKASVKKSVKNEEPSLTFSAFVALTSLLAIWSISFSTVCSLPLLLLLLAI